jgi:hypothetical protein
MIRLIPCVELFRDSPECADWPTIARDAPSHLHLTGDVTPAEVGSAMASRRLGVPVERWHGCATCIAPIHRTGERRQRSSCNLAISRASSSSSVRSSLLRVSVGVMTADAGAAAIVAASGSEAKSSVIRKAASAATFG